MTIARKQARDTPQFGEIWAHNVASNITSVAQNDWDQIVAFNTNGNYFGSVAPDHTNAHVTIGLGGVYQVHFEWSGYGPAVAHDWNFHIAINNMASMFNNITAHTTTPTTQKTQSIGCTGLASFSAGDTVEMWVQRISAGSDVQLTTVHSTINIHKVN